MVAVTRNANKSKLYYSSAYFLFFHQPDNESNIKIFEVRPGEIDTIEYTLVPVLLSDGCIIYGSPGFWSETSTGHESYDPTNNAMFQY